MNARTRGAMRCLATFAILACSVLVASAQQNADIQALKVQGNVYLLTGAGGNVIVQVGDQGVLVVDTGLKQTADKDLAAIRKISDKPIQYILNTHLHPDHTGGNDIIRKAGATFTGANVTGNLTDEALGAQVFAQNNGLKPMSPPTGKQAAMPFGDWPTETYLSARKQMFFNGEPVEVMHQPAAHTDGDSLGWVRRA